MSTQRNLLDLAGEALHKTDSPGTGHEAPRPPKRWKTRVVFPAVIGLGFVFLFGAAARDAFLPAIDVDVSPAIERPATGAARSGSAAVQAAGWIEPSPYPIYVPTLTDGVVEDVLVLEGQSVTKGQVVAQLVDSDAVLALRRAEAMVGEREGMLAAARAEEDAAHSRWEANIDLTREALSTAAMVDETSASLSLARAELRREEAMLTDAESNLRRAEPLADSGAIGEAELINIRSMRDAQQARTQGASDSIAMMEAKLRQLQADAHAAARNLELRTEEKLRLERARAEALKAEADLDRAKAERDEAQLAVDRLQVRAPSDGVVMRRLVGPGSKIMRAMDDPFSEHVIHLYDPAKLQVRVDVPLVDAGKVGRGQKAEVVVEVLPDQVFHGTVVRITNLANIQKNTLEVKVELEDPAEELKPDMLARVRFLAEATTGDAGGATSLFVKQDAVGGGGEQAHVWVVTNFDGRHGTAARRAVQVAAGSSDGWVEVFSGINAGDMAILNAGGGLKEGSRVRVNTTPQEVTNHGVH